jgi:hypothetical protein
MCLLLLAGSSRAIDIVIRTRATSVRFRGILLVGAEDAIVSVAFSLWLQRTRLLIFPGLTAQRARSWVRLSPRLSTTCSSARLDPCYQAVLLWWSNE